MVLKEFAGDERKKKQKTLENWKNKTEFCTWLHLTRRESQVLMLKERQFRIHHKIVMAPQIFTCLRQNDSGHLVNICKQTSKHAHCTWQFPKCTIEKVKMVVVKTIEIVYNAVSTVSLLLLPLPLFFVVHWDCFTVCYNPILQWGHIVFRFTSIWHC